MSFLTSHFSSHFRSCYNRTCESVSLSVLAAFDVRLSVHNSGGIAGGHTVFLFFTLPAVHGAPQKHLLGFEKVLLEGNGKGEVVFKVDACKDLCVVDEDGEKKVVALGGSHAACGQPEAFTECGDLKDEELPRTKEELGPWRLIECL